MYSKLNSYGTDMLRSEFIMEDQGLGKIPSAVRTVGSILLFNSNINPYKNYQALDNLVSTGRFILFIYDIIYDIFYSLLILILEQKNLKKMLPVV